MKKNRLSYGIQLAFLIGLLTVIILSCKKPSKTAEIPDPKPDTPIVVIPPPDDTVIVGGPSDLDAPRLGCHNSVVENTVESPSVKISTPSGGSFQAGKIAITWSFEGTATSATKTKYQAAFTGVDDAALKYGVSGAGSLSVAIKRYANQSALQMAFPHLSSTNFFSKPDGYLIETSATVPNKVTIHAITEPGVVNGLGTLESLMQKNRGVQTRGLITDWPDLKNRGFHLVIKNITSDVAKAAIDRMRRGHYNLLILGITNNVNFQTLINKKLNRECAWSTTEFMQIVNYARECGMLVVPELRFLSHQQDFLSPDLISGPYASLMWPDGSYKTHHPDSSRVYSEFIFPYIDEVISVMNPPYIHIGHDEVYHINGSENPDPSYLTPVKFMQDVITTNNYIAGKGKQTMMWGDMLLSLAEFPAMHPGAINGNSAYAAQRTNLPRNIIVCDWHYKDGKNNQFPSLLEFAKSNKVYGVTHDNLSVINDFTNYTVNNYSNSNIQGMIATGWSTITTASTRNKTSNDNWVSFDTIVEQSAQAFWQKTTP